MPWVGNIAKTMISNGKQFTVTHEMLTTVAHNQSVHFLKTVAGTSACFSKFAFVFSFFKILARIHHLMNGPLGNSEFCFP